MNKQKVVEYLAQKIEMCNILIDEPMKKHTTFKIGGSADIYIKPSSQGQIEYIVDYCKENQIDFMAIGKGSNLLIGDKGYRGIVIEVGKNMSNIEVDDEYIYAEAGAMLINVSYKAYKHSLKGLEFACGIPGTIGGAVVMNAGAYLGEMKQIIVDIKTLDKEGNINTFTNEELKLGYRDSIIQKNKHIVIAVKLKLEKGNAQELKERRLKLTNHRKNGQPLDMPSAGSVFKRPEGYYTGKLIEEAGLKGYTIGGAQVSRKHANFIVNIGNATAKDVVDLVEYIQNVIYEKNHVNLETEVKLIGEM